MFRTWFALRACCACCGLSFERDERDDYWLGAFLLNFIVTEIVFAVVVLAIVVVTWPDPAWSLLLWVGAGQMMVTPVAFYPFAKSLWLAVDLIFRPVNAADFRMPSSAVTDDG